jgi:hypothetical protein
MAVREVFYWAGPPGEPNDLSESGWPPESAWPHLAGGWFEFDPRYLYKQDSGVWVPDYEHLDAGLEKAKEIGKPIILQCRMLPGCESVPDWWAKYVLSKEGYFARWTWSFAERVLDTYEIVADEAQKLGVEVIGASAGLGDWSEMTLGDGEHWEDGLTLGGYAETLCLLVDAIRSLGLDPYLNLGGCRRGADGWLEHIESVVPQRIGDTRDLTFGHHGGNTRSKMEAQGMGWVYWQEATALHRQKYGVYFEPQSVRRGGPSTVGEWEQMTEYLRTQIAPHCPLQIRLRTDLPAMLKTPQGINAIASFVASADMEPDEPPQHDEPPSG